MMNMGPLYKAHLDAHDRSKGKYWTTHQRIFHGMEIQTSIPEISESTGKINGHPSTSISCY
jgi:hypothetical protein